ADGAGTRRTAKGGGVPDAQALGWVLPGAPEPQPGWDAEGPPDVDGLLRRVVNGAAELTGACDGLVWLVEDGRLVARCGTGRFGASELALARVLGELAGAAVDHALRAVAAQHQLLRRASTEAWLRANELRFRTLVEQIDAITYSEAYAVGGAHMMYVSPQVLDKLGYTPEEAGRPGFWKTLVHPDDRDRVLAEDARVELSGAPWRMEYRVTARDGRVLWV